MEDEVFLSETFSVKSKVVTSPLSFYGVFDGHGGKQAAIYTKNNIHHHLVEELEKGRAPAEALHAAFIRTDTEFISNSKDSSGTTAVTCLIEHSTRKLWVANVGDSRALLCRRGAAIPLSKDHKADRPDEVDRIRKAGGFVFHKRVMGELAVSRAIGDADFKENVKLVVADPEIQEEQLIDDDEFLLLACDGLYDVMSNDDVVAYVRESFLKGSDAQDTTEAIALHAINGLHTRDNVSVVIVRFKFPKTAKPTSVEPIVTEEDLVVEEVIGPASPTDSASSSFAASPASSPEEIIEVIEGSEQRSTPSSTPPSSASPSSAPFITSPSTTNITTITEHFTLPPSK